MHPLDLQEATLAPTREESCLGIFHLQDFPSTAKITVLFLSGRHECVRSELCFKWKLPERTLLCFFLSVNLLEVPLLENKFRCWQLWRLYLYSVSMRGSIWEKEPCKKLWGIAEAKWANRMFWNFLFWTMLLYYLNQLVIPNEDWNLQTNLPHDNHGLLWKINVLIALRLQA